MPLGSASRAETGGRGASDVGTNDWQTDGAGTGGNIAKPTGTATAGSHREQTRLG